jgi:hypothetical protein
MILELILGHTQSRFNIRGSGRASDPASQTKSEKVKAVKE